MDKVQLEKMRKKVFTTLKLSGFPIRREYCSIIVDRFLEGGVDLQNSSSFNEVIKQICTNLENQCVSDQSIEKEFVELAIELCLNQGYDRHETIFNVINAFDFPRLAYNFDRKQYYIDEKKSKVLADADTKAKLYIDRYNTILQRTKRNFTKVELKLQTVDYLLTVSNADLDKTLILGALTQVTEGKFFLEDTTGMVELDLKHAKFHCGFFCEQCIVLVNGYYEDRILHVSSITVPPGEEYEGSRRSFGSINYFGGPSKQLLRNSKKLGEEMSQNDGKIFFFSDLWLDRDIVFEKLQIIFDGIQEIPPIAFVFLGNFMSSSHGSEFMLDLKKLFQQLAELILKYPNLVDYSQFVFVPGLNDPCTPYVVPRFGLPDLVVNEMKRLLPKTIFATNPCRIQYCTREIVVFRANLVAKFLQGTLFKPSKLEIGNCVSNIRKITTLDVPLNHHDTLEQSYLHGLEVSKTRDEKRLPNLTSAQTGMSNSYYSTTRHNEDEHVTRTIISQGHLSPLPLNALTVHWDFDHCLRLYPLPDLVVVGDKFEAFHGSYKGCEVTNPGSFCEAGFQFKSYNPFSNLVEDCQIDD